MRILLLFVLLHLASHCHSIRTQLHKNPSLCSLDCSNSRKRPVCGSDGVTYSSRCELDKASCRNRDLRVGYRGECFSVKERCFEERRSAMKTSNESGIAIFIPKCHPNGNYVNVQCHYGTGYCWCVNEVGKPVPGSSVRYKKPKCNKKKAPRKRTRRGKKGTRKRHAKRICSQSDRMQFNNYVIELITSEFRKSGQVLHSSTHYHSRKSNPKKEMVDWKFQKLDSDGNGIIKRREFGDFRKGVKRMSRNKQCAVTFWRYCDMNNDKKMTPTEWNTCLGVDVNVSFRLFLSLNAKEDPLKQRQDSVKAKEKPSFVKSPSILNSGRQTMDTSRGDNSNQKAKGCRQGRSKTSSLGSEDAFVPECTSNGKYQRVQCFTSTGYCWCADEETGAPIPGTSIRNARPQCTDEDISSRMKESSSNPISTGRAWKKCPEPQKKEFQKNLIQIFKILYSRSHQAHNEHAANLNKKIVQWQFNAMDRNRDGLLSKKELKSLRVKIKKDHRLKRCGKRLPIHCDIDQSNSISLSEWEICIGVEEESSQSSSIGSIGGKRRGVNPLKKYLKAD
uniref:SPARCrelated modular calciumbinding protein 1like [Bombus impatiens] n=1 Tax=Lepeophtheirus salmonis TaxID=72036 RepID=A0A0K2TMA6_LEPSM